MTFTDITRGTTNWDVPVNAEFHDLDNRLTSVETEQSGSTYYWLVASNQAPASVKAKADFTCDGTDDQAQVQAAIDAAASTQGGIVQLSAGDFAFTAPVTLKPRVTITGTQAAGIFNTGQIVAASRILIGATFVGGAAIVLLGQTAGGYSAKAADSNIFTLTIDGTSGPAGIHGIQGSDYISGVYIRDVTVRRPTGKGIYTFTQNGSQPFSWTFEHVLVDNAGDVGIHLINHTDVTMVDVTSIGSGTHSYQISNAPNSRVIGCRAEWSGAHGFKLEGNFGTGQGSGGIVLAGCTTDRNGQNGVDITTTGNGPILLSGITTRRDGRNGGAGGGGYSGIFASAATTPVIISGWSQYPGVDDDGTGTNSPQVGGTFSNNTSVQITGAYVHGATTAVTQSGNTSFLLDGATVYATGTTAAPVRTPQNIFVDVAGDTMTGLLANTTGAAVNVIYSGKVTGDTQDRVQVRGDGRINWGPGNAATDTDLFRSSTGSLMTDGFFGMASGQSSGDFTVYTGNLKALRAGTAGGGLAITEGANARLGTLVLTGATPVVVPNTSVTATTRILLTANAPGGTPGHFWVSARTAGTSFSVTGTAGDTSTVAYLLVEPN